MTTNHTDSAAERLMKLWQRFKTQFFVWWHESDEDMLG